MVMAKYDILRSGNITKDGHNMFMVDVIKDLNRKSFLEQNKLDDQEKIQALKLENERLEAEICRLQNGIIKTYHAIHDWANNRESVGIYEISKSLKELLKGDKHG